MEYKEFRCELQEKGLLVEYGYSRFIIGYHEQGSVQYTVAAQWCRNQGGNLPTIEQALIISEHKRHVDEVLRGAGRDEIGEHLWTRRRHAISDDSIYIVNTRNGHIGNFRRDYYNGARCIIAAGS